MNNNQIAIVVASDRGYRIDNHGYGWNPAGDQLIGNPNPQGYRVFSIKINGKKRVVLFHRLQAYQKYGLDLFEKGVMVRHKNCNKIDNSIDNILLGSAMDNYLDNSDETKTKLKEYGLLGASKIKKHDHTKIKDHYKAHGFRSAMQEFGISSKGTMSYIINH